MKFNNAEEMLRTLDTCDLYNLETGDYVFLYNEYGSICVYGDIDREEAAELDRLSRENGEYWCTLLGAGGSIYDDKSYPTFGEDCTSNLDYCEGVYDKGNWIDTEDFA